MHEGFDELLLTVASMYRIEKDLWANHGKRELFAEAFERVVRGKRSNSASEPHLPGIALDQPGERVPRPNGALACWWAETNSTAPDRGRSRRT